MYINAFHTYEAGYFLCILFFASSCFCSVPLCSIVKFFFRKKTLFLSATLKAKKKRRSKFVISHPITINSWQTFVNIFTAGSNLLTSIFQINDLVCLLFFVFAVFKFLLTWSLLLFRKFFVILFCLDHSEHF